MNIVQPIRNLNTIQEIKGMLKERNERNYILFLFGIQTGLRISDILKLKVKDVQGWTIFIKEGKTGKPKEVKMPPELKKAVRQYVQGKYKNDFLFQSRQKDKKGRVKPISRGMAYIILQEIADEFDLERIGCHSLRKTYGYHHYNQYKDIAVLQEALNHSNQEITMRYIGITQDKQNKYQTGLRI
ncbi:tyrosine-type recombinase/integrase [Peribacillus frigoritolerans]|uniref:tyrosine-type recombinase/integrase n=1 Tax=Peribacillus frigoritolerans TaxID=450367 RepID=UPI0007BEEB0E